MLGLCFNRPTNISSLLPRQYIEISQNNRYFAISIVTDDKTPRCFQYDRQTKRHSAEIEVSNIVETGKVEFPKTQNQDDARLFFLRRQSHKDDDGSYTVVRGEYYYSSRKSVSVSYVRLRLKKQACRVHPIYVRVLIVCFRDYWKFRRNGYVLWNIEAVKCACGVSSRKYCLKNKV